MNRNPARPKIMRPCICESQYHECNCGYLAEMKMMTNEDRNRVAGVFVALFIGSVIILAVCIYVIMGSWMFS